MDYKDYTAIQGTLESARANWDSLYREIAQYVRPDYQFFNSERTQGVKNDQLKIDDTAPLAFSKAVAAFMSLTMPSTQIYQQFTPSDTALKDDKAVGVGLDKLAEYIFDVRYSPLARYSSQAQAKMSDILSFGTGVMFVDEVVAKGIRYKCFPLAECYIDQDDWGVVDRVHRKFKLSARQALLKFKENCPEKIRIAAERNDDRTFTFLHAVGLNYDRAIGKKDASGMEYSSCYLSLDEPQIIERGGYRTMPYVVTRYETAPNEVYGRSPIMNIRSAIKTVNQMKYGNIAAAQRVQMPAWLVSDDGAFANTALSFRSGAVNFGGLDFNGRPKVMAMESGVSNFQFPLEVMSEERQIINEGLFVTLFKVLVDQPQKTATQVMAEAREKGELMGPFADKISSEWLPVLTDREIDILSVSGSLPELPQKLLDAGGGYKIKYTSPIESYRAAAQAEGLLNYVNGVAVIAQLDPSVTREINSREALKILRKANNVPNSVVYSDDELKVKDEEAAQQNQAQQLLAAAPVAASAAKDLSQAAATMPNQQLPDIFPA